MVQGAIERDGGHLLIDQLLIQGVDTVFSVPGESFLPAINALFDHQKDINLVVCRQEGGAAFMADAYAKLTRKAGICFVTRGPGASNASIGVHTAFQDSTPLILFVGQVGSEFSDREAFQELDYRQMFGQMAKWVAQVNSTDRIPEYVTKAFQIATSGRPGPVVLALPEDVLSSTSKAIDGKRYKKIKASASPDDFDKVFSLLEASRYPLLLLGGSDWSPKASESIEQFAGEYCLPVSCTFRRQNLINNSHDSYCGDVGIGINPALKSHILSSDLIIAVGPRLGEITSSGYTLFQNSNLNKKLVHVHQGVEELGTVYSADLMINSGMEEFTSGLLNYEKNQIGNTWGEWTKKLRGDYLKTLEVGELSEDFADLSLFVDKLKTKITPDAIITNGAGNYTGWIQRYWQYSRAGAQLAPTSGAMGYGVPSGVAAGLIYPDKRVVSFSGDGCFLMNGQELATAIQYGVKVLFVVVNNGMYGTIRLHQEKAYPARVYGTSLINPDFVALGKSYGLYAELITHNDQINDTLDRVLSKDVSSLIEVKVDPHKITHRSVLPP